MSGRATRAGYRGKASEAYNDALAMIKKTGIKTGHVDIKGKESEYLIHFNLPDVIKRAKYGNIIETELHTLRPYEFPEPGADVFTAAERLLIDKVRKSSIDIHEVMRFVDKLE
jgi:hypothetical protein